MRYRFLVLLCSSGGFAQNDAVALQKSVENIVAMGQEAVVCSTEQHRLEMRLAEINSQITDAHTRFLKAKAEHKEQSARATHDQKGATDARSQIARLNTEGAEMEKRLKILTPTQASLGKEIAEQKACVTRNRTALKGYLTPKK